jgi:hypothetical protein
VRRAEGDGRAAGLGLDRGVGERELALDARGAGEVKLPVRLREVYPCGYGCCIIYK